MSTPGSAGGATPRRRSAVSTSSAADDSHAPQRGLVLAAHGAGPGRSANERIDALARRLGDRLGLAGATAAYHRGEPSYATALDALGCAEVVVVPLLTSRGYYSDTVLPRELRRNRCHSRVEIRWTEPLGVQEGISELVVRRVRHLADAHGLARPRVAIVGHGTPRHPESRLATETLAAAFERAGPFPCGAFFLDEEPGLGTLRSTASGADTIVVPFFVGGGRHVARDLHRGLGLPESPDDETFVGTMGERRAVVDVAVGLYDGVEDLIVETVRRLDGRGR